MRTGLFDNSKNALVFGGCVLVAAVMFIGEESEDSAPDLNSQTFTYEERYVPPRSQDRYRERQPEIGDLSDFYGSADSDEIDDPEGFDPTPSDRTTVRDYSPNRNSSERGEQPPGIDGPGT